MVKGLLKQKLANKFSGVDFDRVKLDFDILTPPNDKMGDYSTNIAFTRNRGNAEESESTEMVAQKIVEELKQDKDLAGIFEKIEAAKPGFINFYFKNDFLRKKLSDIGKEKDYGLNETMKGKKVIVEYTDPNPFKLFHIGHLMSNTIGEAIARLYESSGAKVIRVTWQGDVGMHIAMAVWAMINMKHEIWNMEQISQAYATGAKAHKNDERSKREIEEINKKIYDRSDAEINKVYDLGKKVSLEYFERIYKRLGSKFDRYFFESELGPKGLEIVKKHPEVFEESQGAIIFKGEKYGLHTRVFINSSGLPVYEAKELGLNKEKFDLYNPDLSVIITGNEINDYFKVLLKAMELVMPEVARKTVHLGHGMLRLPTGKMSSRTGDVITADSLIEQTKSKLPESDTESAREEIAVGAIKYSILKQSPGHDIVFDFEKSLSVKGDSAPYLQYTYARLNSILEKAKEKNKELGIMNYGLLNHELELKLIKRILMFPDVILESAKDIAPQHLALYLYELAVSANQFYEQIRVLDDKNVERRNARLGLIHVTADVLQRGLNILGIETLKRI